MTQAPESGAAMPYVPAPSERLLGERYTDVFDDVMTRLAACERVVPLSREAVVYMVIDFALAAAEEFGCIEAALDADRAGTEEES